MTNFQLPLVRGNLNLSVRLQLPKYSRGYHSTDFKRFIYENIGEDCVVALGRLTFPNEWLLELKDSDVRERLLRMHKTKINMRTCFITPLSQTELRGHVWLPTQIPDANVAKALEEYGDMLPIDRMFHYETNSDMLYFALFLKYGTTSGMVPYFIYVNGYRVFVSIRGKRPICFNCEKVGHCKNECGNKKRTRGKRHKSVECINAMRRVEQSIVAPIGSVQQVNVLGVVEPMNVARYNVPEDEQSMEERVGQPRDIDQSMDPGRDENSEQEPPMEEDQLPEPVATEEDRHREEFSRVLEFPSSMADLSSVPNPIAQLQELQEKIVHSLEHTRDVMNERIKIITRLLCEELKVQKKKQEKK